MPVHQAFLLNPTPFGDQEYTTAGTFSWVAPAGVFVVDAVAVGGGGGGGTNLADASSGGGGGGLGWKNSIAVVPGTSYTVVVGSGGAVLAAGGQSSFVSAATVAGNGGSPGANGTIAGGAGGTFVGDGGGNGGQGGDGSTNDAANAVPEAGAGGGAGGYSGAGGRGAGAQTASTTGSAGQGGAGGGGGSGDSGAAGGGGGVGLQGEAQSGTGGTGTARGGGGSGGTGGTATPIGGAYGGGGAGADATTSGAGGGGAVRIAWGYNRTFPSTNAGNLFNTATRNPLDIHPWLSAAGLSACTIARDTAVTDSPAGGVPLRMSVTGADPHIGTYANATYNIAPAANGQTWRVSVLAKASTATTMQILVFGAALTGSWTNLAGNIGGSAIFNVSTAWQDYLYDFTFANATVAFFQFRFDGPEAGGAGQNLWFDNVRVARIS